ncbi:MAG: hypothetical protein CL908_02545 [Deltaproteobacteria bacterium]|jgi:hypothetical protein|nr:hypothetical protein [Deltaproteobacteria bacterium]
MLDALGNVGDFLGGLAVVVTLIYLAIQVRSNTAALRTASRQDIVTGMRNHIQFFADPRVWRAYVEGLSGFPDMPFDERGQFSTTLFDHSLSFQSVFALHESGQLEDETYQSYLAWFSCQLATPGGSAWWEESRTLFPARMADAVEERLAQGNLPDVREFQTYRPDESRAVLSRNGFEEHR